MKVGRCEIEVIKGDITEMETDAIVNAANNRLWMGGGVAGAIKRKGGRIIEEEAVKQGPIEIGEAVVTTAGKLKARYVIHAAGMGMDFKTDEEKIRKATRNSLKRAEELGIKSIAFPAIGTGVGRFPLEKAAEVMIGETVDFLQQAQRPEKVVFVLFSDESFRAFERELSKFD